METQGSGGDALVEQLRNELRDLREELETLRTALGRPLAAQVVPSDEPWLSLPPWRATAA